MEPILHLKHTANFDGALIDISSRLNVDRVSLGLADPRPLGLGFIIKQMRIAATTRDAPQSSQRLLRRTSHGTS